MGGKRNLQRVLEMNSKEHFKSYKVGKVWLFTSIASLTLGFGLFYGSSLTSYAVATDQTSVATSGSADSGATNNTAAPDTIKKTDSTPESTTNTDNLTAASSQLQQTVDTAKDTGVTVTQKPSETVKTMPDQLSNTVASVKNDYDQQEQAINAVMPTQKQDNEAYEAAKDKYDRNVVDIKSTNKSWTDAELVKLLAGGGDKTDVTGITDVTETEKTAASDEAKKAAVVTLKPGYTVTLADGTPVNASTQLPLDSNTKPTWTYNNAFVDPQTGDNIDVVETITGYTPSKNTRTDPLTDPNKPHVYKISTQYIGFQPYNVQDVSAKLDYIDARTGKPVKIDAVMGMSDIDGNQGVIFNNDYATLLRGSAITKDATTGAYKDTHDNTFGNTDPKGQVWILQKDVSETDYTFYVGLNPDGTVNNNLPEQYIGGASFSVQVPSAPKLTSETASYTETTIQVPTIYTVHYEGAGDATPADTTTPIIWTGSYNADSGKYTWTPDQTSINVPTPAIDGYRVDSAQSSWALGPIITDPADHNMTVVYQQQGQVPDENSTDQTSNLIVHYVDENGNPLGTDTQTSGKIGEPFTVTAVNVAGYTLLSQSMVKGTYQGNQMNVTFVYQKVPDTPSVPRTPEIPAAPETPTTPDSGQPATGVEPNQPSASISNESKKSTETGESNGTATSEKASTNLQATTPLKTDNGQGISAKQTSGSASQETAAVNKQSDSNTARSVSKAKLPQTNEQSTSVWTVIGLSMLSLLNLLGLAGTKRRENDK